MSGRIVVVEREEQVGSLPWPEWAQRARVVLVELAGLGLWQGLSDLVHLRRRAGSYEMVDLFLFCVAYFASGQKPGFKKFAAEAARFGDGLAAAAGRMRFMGQSAVSRALSSVCDSSLRELGEALRGVLQGLPVPEALAELGHRDAFGRPWAVFHHDSSNVGCRERQLPTGDDLPEARRRTPKLAQPGYPGRKRWSGLAQRGMTQHAGFGAWVAATVHPGTGTRVEVTAAGAAAAAQWGSVGDAVPDGGSTMVYVGDGGGGGWQLLAAASGAGLCVLTRSSEYGFFDDPEFLARLGVAEWFQVEDSRSGPLRSAAEVALWRPVGGEWLRLVVSRFKSAEAQTERAGSGVTVGDEHYELFITNTPADAWPAQDVVRLYYDRCGQENAFARLNDRYDLQRVFHFTPQGQAVATLAAIVVWNLELRLGLAASDPIDLNHPALQPQPRQDVRVPPPAQPPEDAPRDSHGAPAESAGPCASSEAEPDAAAASGRGLDAEPGEVSNESSTSAPRVSASEANDVLPGGTEEVPELAPNPGSNAATLPIDSRSTAIDATIDAFIERHPGWTRSAGAVVCPAGKALTISFRPSRTNPTQVRLRAATKACVDCPLRHDCARNGQPGPFYRFDAALRIRGDLPVTPKVAASPATSPRIEVLRPKRRAAPKTHELNLNPPTPAPGPWRCEMSRLVICAVLNASRDRDPTRAPFSIRVQLPAPAPPLPPIIAPTPAARQQRRKTFAERLEWNALPPGTRVVRTSYRVTGQRSGEVAA